MEILHIIFIILYSLALGMYLAYIWLIDDIKNLKKLRYGDLRGIVIRNDIIHRLKAENKELIERVKELEEQDRKIN